ncbi:MAG: hypothetical protein HYU86_04050 [Chloroflexi bacterium]|nr:hypothetical protein [Chloroflexota bacterium]
MKTLRENLLVQFSIVSFFVTVATALLMTWGLTTITRQNILDEAKNEAVDTLADRVLNKLTPADLQNPMTGQRYDEFHRFVQESVVSRRTARIKIWSRDGRVIYSTDKGQVGEQYPIKPELATALGGGTAAEISVPSSAENARERLLGTLIEVYAPIIFSEPRQPAGAFEIYQYYAPFAEFIDRTREAIYLFAVMATIGFYLALFLIVRRGWNTIQEQQRDLTHRVREIDGLNRITRSYLNQRYWMSEEIRKLVENLNSHISIAHSDCPICSGVTPSLVAVLESLPTPPSGMSSLGLTG